MENKIMEGQNQLCQGVSTSKGKGVGLALGALGVLGGIVTAVVLKNRKNKNKVEDENPVVENNETIVEE
jgi:hypothetical protein